MALSSRWLLGAAVCAISSFTQFGFEGRAQAQSTCAYASGSFDCDDGDGATPAASGTYTAEASGRSGYGTLNFYNNGGSLDAELVSGEIIGSPNALAVNLTNWNGSASFTSSGTISNRAGYGLYVFGSTVDVTSGNVSISEAIGGTSAVGAVAYAGNATLNAGVTTADNGYGIVIRATGGSALTNTGTISVTGGRGWGLRSDTLSLGGVCGTNTVNVTGNITVPAVGALLMGCGDTTLNVEAGQTVKNSLEDWVTVANYAPVGTATTVIAGTIQNEHLSGPALTSWGANSFTDILAGGRLLGRYNDYTDGENVLHVHQGGEWQTTGINAFWNGNDTVLLEGRLATSGSTSLPGLDSFVNSGTIDMQNGSAADILSMDGDYVGSGSATLLVDARGDQVDRLQIAGNASGTTTIIVDSDGLVDPQGLTIVEAGSMTPGAFVIQNSQATRLISYSLVADGGDLRVVALPNATAYQPLLVPAFAANLWFESAEAIWAQSRFGGGQLRDRKVGLWVQPFAGGGSFSGSSFRSAFGGSQVISNGRANLDNKGLQMGVKFSPIPGLAQIGAAVGYTRARLGQQAFDGEIRASTFSAALYAQAGGATGPYGLVMVKRDWNRTNLTGDAFSSASNDPDGGSFGLAAEAGVRWTSRAFNLETGLRVSRVTTEADGFAAEGINYAFKDNTALRVEFSAGVKSTGRTAYYARGKLMREFGDGGAMILTSGDEADSVNAGGRGTWARLEAGLHFTGAGNIVAGLWTDVGSTKGLGLRAGVSF